MIQREIINPKNNNVPRLRTLPQAFEELKREDPDTAMTMRALRRMVNTGELPTVHIESKRLINMPVLFNYLSCSDEQVSHVI